MNSARRGFVARMLVRQKFSELPGQECSDFDVRSRLSIYTRKRDSNCFAENGAPKLGLAGWSVSI
jgi:hypothetical protein